MKCDDIHELTNLFVDGELEAEGQQELFGHLGECPECRSFLQALLGIREVLHREQVDFPAEIDRVVTEAVKAAKAPLVPVWRRSIRLPVPVAAAAVLLIALIGVLTFSVIVPGEPVRKSNVPNTYVQNDVSDARVIYVLPEIIVTADSSAASSEDSRRQ